MARPHGDQSYDDLAGSLDATFDFEHQAATAIVFDPATGRVVQ